MKEVKNHRKKRIINKNALTKEKLQKMSEKEFDKHMKGIYND